MVAVMKPECESQLPLFEMLRGVTQQEMNNSLQLFVRDQPRLWNMLYRVPTVPVNPQISPLWSAGVSLAQRAHENAFRFTPKEFKPAFHCQPQNGGRSIDDMLNELLDECVTPFWRNIQNRKKEVDADLKFVASVMTNEELRNAMPPSNLQRHDKRLKELIDLSIKIDEFQKLIFDESKEMDVIKPGFILKKMSDLKFTSEINAFYVKRDFDRIIRTQISHLPQNSLIKHFLTKRQQPTPVERTKMLQELVSLKEKGNMIKQIFVVLGLL
jgi:hypothetical protein